MTLIQDPKFLYGLGSDASIPGYTLIQHPGEFVQAEDAEGQRYLVQDAESEWFLRAMHGLAPRITLAASPVIVKKAAPVVSSKRKRTRRDASRSVLT